MVLRYLNNTTSRFQTFVANRLELLHSLTSVRQRRYVPTAVNPADVASRGLSPEKVNSADMWFYGPKFLRECESQWPEQPDLMEGLEEVTSNAMCAFSTAWNDGLVRRARIRTAHGSVDRDIRKVCLLEGVRDTVHLIKTGEISGILLCTSILLHLCLLHA